MNEFSLIYIDSTRSKTAFSFAFFKSLSIENVLLKFQFLIYEIILK